VFRFAYLIGDLIFLSVWGFLFWRRKDLRRQMLVMSLIVAVLGPISEYWYFRDYWRPLLILRPAWPLGGLEDVLFGFAIGGVAAVLYENILGKRFSQGAGGKRGWIGPLFFGGFIASLLVFNDFLGINSIYASSLGTLLVALIIVVVRPDLFFDSLLSGLFVAMAMFILYYVYSLFWTEPWVKLSQVWLLYGTPHVILLAGRIPLTEMIWGICWGIAVGPLYEFWQGCRLKEK